MQINPATKALALLDTALTSGATEQHLKVLHDRLLAAVRAGKQEADWEAYPLGRDWWLQHYA